jgi:hypothetical protein
MYFEYNRRFCVPNKDNKKSANTWFALGNASVSLGLHAFESAQQFFARFDDHALPQFGDIIGTQLLDGNLGDFPDNCPWSRPADENGHITVFDAV